MRNPLKANVFNKLYSRSWISKKFYGKHEPKFSQTCFSATVPISAQMPTWPLALFSTLFSSICMRFWTERFNQTLFTDELYSPNKSPRKCVYSVRLWRELKALSSYSRCWDGLQLPCYSISARLFHGWSCGIIEYSWQTQCFNTVICNQAET